MQAMERFLEVADESNPLRLVARQNLTQLTVQVSDTRQLSLQRDDLTARRIGVQKSSAATDKEIKNGDHYDRAEERLQADAYEGPYVLFDEDECPQWLLENAMRINDVAELRNLVDDEEDGSDTEGGE